MTGVFIITSLHPDLNAKTNGKINSKINARTIGFEHYGCV